MIVLDKTKFYYLEDLTIPQLREVAAAIVSDEGSSTLWTHNGKDLVDTLIGCLNTKRLLFFRRDGNHYWLYQPKGFKVEAGDYTNAKSLFAVNNIEFKNKKVCII
mgnify:FL=1